MGLLEEYLGRYELFGPTNSIGKLNTLKTEIAYQWNIIDHQHTKDSLSIEIASRQVTAANAGYEKMIVAFNLDKKEAREYSKTLKKCVLVVELKIKRVKQICFTGHNFEESWWDYKSAGDFSNQLPLHIGFREDRIKNGL